MRWINRKPGKLLTIFLAAMPFAAIVLAYLIASEARLSVNPADKLLPAPSRMFETFMTYATEPSKRTGELLLWKDTAASLMRLAVGVGLAALIGLCFGLYIGLVPAIGATLGPFAAAVSLVPPLAILPILFIVFGLGEVAKIALIVFGVAPFLIRDMAERTHALPMEQRVKAQTLGASTWLIALRVALPQIMPRLITSVRLALGSAWLFLIAAEAIASTEGLGYRIFLVRRYLAMDVILPYVLWITFLAFLIDWSLKTLSRKLYPWTEVQE